MYRPSYVPIFEMPPSRYHPTHPSRPLFLNTVLPQAEEIRQAKLCRTTSHKAGPPNILTLPNELLLNIARHIDGKNCKEEVKKNIKDWRSSTLERNRSQDLRNLILTCQQLAPIGREVLLDNVVISRSHLWRLLDFLLQYPELIMKVTRVQLKPTKDIHVSTNAALIAPASSIRINLDMAKTAIRELRGLLRTNPNSNSDCMPILLSLCPNLREITLGLSCSISADPDCIYRTDDLTLPSVFSSSWPPALAAQIIQNLAVVNILQDNLLWAETKGPFELKTLTNLKSLSMPFLNAIPKVLLPRWAHWYRSQTPSEDVPPNLKSLTLYVDNIYGSFLYHWLDHILFPPQPLVALESVRLYTLCPLETHTAFFDYSFRNSLPDTHAMVAALENSPTSLQTFFLPVADYDSAVLANYEEENWRLHLAMLLRERQLLDASTQSYPDT